MAKVVLLDGNSLVYRAFYALPASMATASGQITNAVYGFTSMLIKVWRDHLPDQVVTAFDRPEPTFRHERVPSYKATRKPTPDILRQQMGLVREVLGALGVRTAEAIGYEADDVIATLATQGRDAGYDVIVVTGDRDSFQLVEDPHVKVLYTLRGVSDYALYDEAGIVERIGVDPAEYVVYASLCGDTSDNLPGVPGVGPKTASRLVNTHHSLDAVFASLDELTPKLRQNLAASELQVRSNEQVMRLVRDVPLEASLDDLRMAAPDSEAVQKLFDFLEFRQLRPRLAELPYVFGDASADESPTPELIASVTVCSSPAEAAGMLWSFTDADCGTLPVGLAAAPGGVSEGFAFVTDSAAAAAAFVPGPLIEHDEVNATLRGVLGRDPAGAARPLAAHGAKSLMRGLLDAGVEMRDPWLDTRLAAYLLDPSDTRYELSDLLARHTGMAPPPDSEEGQLSFDGAAVETAERTGWAALAAERLSSPMRTALASQGLADLNDNVEIPLVRVLTRMEHIGIGVDPEVLRRIRDELRTEAARLRDEVLALAGRDFNINSPKQLGAILFDELGLTPLKRTKTGYSTDARTLERLKGEHEIVGCLLEYRAVEKLRSTYGEGLLAEVGPGDRIRATFNQTVARTGRLSSDAPNLHNIPVRSERGRVFRTAFIAPSGSRLLVADYDQIELRCIAHLSQDPGLIAAFDAGDDIHTATAAHIFGIDPASVGVEERSTAKMVSYGLAYGMEAYGLGQRLNIRTSEASQILDAYFEAFPKVRRYMQRTVEEARQRGYTETLFGRRRKIPELASPNARLRSAGERQAMNAGIQGLAADIFKVALVRLDHSLEAEGLCSRIVLQVHDEIIVESPLEEVEAAAQLTAAVMRGAFELRAPLEVDLKVARTWADAKD